MTTAHRVAWPVHGEGPVQRQNAAADGPGAAPQHAQAVPPTTYTHHPRAPPQQLNERPLIFPLSNPTSRSECTCEEAAAATDGRAIFACGSPFPDATAASGRVVRANQGNNFFVFPGVGLGVWLCGASVVSDNMLIAAAEALPKLLTATDLEAARIYPRVCDIRSVSAHVAAAVMRAAAADGAVRAPEAKRMLQPDVSDEELRAWVVSKMYWPAYVPLVTRPHT